jgi:phosphatidylserine/phosphatidylglycerophosphate/cardiolipin synthase-like enzyme
MPRNAKIALKTGVLVWGLVGLGAYGLWNRHSVAVGPGGKKPQIDVLFSPDGGCTDRIIEEIENAKKRVLVQAYFFTSKPIAEAMCDAQKRGVDCLVIADKSQEKMTYGRLPVLRRDGVTVLIDHNHAIANNKIILIDKTTIMTGSLNYTKAAEDKNAENLLIIKGYPDLFEKYLDNFKRHKSHARRYKRGG